MRKAINFREQNEVRRLAQDHGMTPEEISFHMRVELAVVNAFMPKKPKAKRKPKANPAPEQKQQDDILADMGEEIA